MNEARANRTNIARAVSNPSGMIARRLNTLATEVRAEMVANASGPVVRKVTGRSVEQIGQPRRESRPTGPAVVIGTTGPLRILHDGTEPHVIEPIPPTRALRFRVGGRLVFARRVHHPGTEPRPFARLALQSVMRRRFGASRR